MANYNRVILMGRLTRDVELSYSQGGMAIAKVGLAVSDRRKNQTGEWVDEPVFVDVTMFGRTAEIAGEYLAKGEPVFIEGRLKFDTWEKEGQKRSKLYVICDKLQLMGSKSESGGTGSNASGGNRGKPTSNSNQSSSNNQSFESRGTSSQSNHHSNHGDDNDSEVFQEENIPF